MSEGTGDERSGAGTARRVRSGAPIERRVAPPRPVQSRYSRFVSAMKVALPLGAVVLFVVILFYSGAFDRKDDLDIAFREIDRQPGDLRMVSPRVAGMTSDGNPYLVTADNATQDITRPNFVRFENIHADVKLNEEQDWMSLTARSGLYDSELQTLELEQQIDIFTTWGYEMHGQSATIDFERGELRSETGVQGHGPLGTLQADRMTADRASQVLRFDGNVRMLILPGQRGEGGE
ncbi:LPS export ABC transporter periplasmic protein LptC [Parvibaculum sp.]|uniref:LPS export ABC transporter periplasmic protein LptC n=1 Tax=Parvibaculum sp. TaxID=2024848 RepID=UPI00391930B5